MRRPVIIDTDPAIGYAGRDVDDGLAILALLADPSCEVVGLTVTFGNVSLSRGLARAREICVRAGRPEIPVLPGAAGPYDLGRETEATRFLQKSARDFRGNLCVLAIGPVTNIASAALLDPEFLPFLKELWVLGGIRGNPARFPWQAGFEFNFRQDIPAARYLLAHAEGMTLFPMEPCRTITLGYRDLWRLWSLGGAAAWAARKSVLWSALAPFLWRTFGFHPWDVLPALALSQPELASYRAGRYEVGEGGELLEARGAGAKIRVVMDIDARGFWRMFWKRFSLYRNKI